MSIYSMTFGYFYIKSFHLVILFLSYYIKLISFNISFVKFNLLFYTTNNGLINLPLSVLISIYFNFVFKIIDDNL